MRRIRLLLTVTTTMTMLVMMTAVPAMADHTELSDVECADILTGIPENPDFCVVDTSTIDAGETFQCDNVLFLEENSPYCVVDGGTDLGYLVPLGA